MNTSRRTFLKQLGALGAFALISPTGAIQAIVPKAPVSLAGMAAIDAEILQSIRGQAIAEEFAKYCQSRPRGDVGRSICAVETIISERNFGRLVRGLSIGKGRRTAKYFNYMVDDNFTLSRNEFERFCKDALKQIELAWIHDPRRKWRKPWGVAPPTMTHKQAHRYVVAGRSKGSKLINEQRR